MPIELTASAQRAQDRHFVTTCSWSALRDRVPLPWPTPPDTPPSPKKHYRSHYLSPGHADLNDLTAWEHLNDFDLVLRLVDFTGLRPVLAQRLGWVSACGFTPFDPISFFLLNGWQLTNHWTRAETLTHLRDKRYADYAERFGFEHGVWPTEGGVRYFLTALGEHSEWKTITVDDEQSLQIGWQRLNDLIVQSVELLRIAGLLSPDAWSQALICPDGMLHAAASRMNCTAVTDTCYQPSSPEALRGCAAKEKEHQGCACDTLACVSVCRHATPPRPRRTLHRLCGLQSPHGQSQSVHRPNRGEGTRQARLRLSQSPARIE